MEYGQCPTFVTGHEDGLNLLADPAIERVLFVLEKDLRNTQASKLGEVLFQRGNGGGILVA